MHSLPAHAITPVGRIDGSGTTSFFSCYLSFSGAWSLGNRTLVGFPACVTRVKGTPGIITAVQSTPFAIGCASLLYLPSLAWLHLCAVSVQALRACLHPMATQGHLWQGCHAILAYLPLYCARVPSPQHLCAREVHGACTA